MKLIGFITLIVALTCVTCWLIYYLCTCQKVEYDIVSSDDRIYYIRAIHTYPTNTYINYYAATFSTETWFCNDIRKAKGGSLEWARDMIKTNFGLKENFSNTLRSIECSFTIEHDRLKRIFELEEILLNKHNDAAHKELHELLKQLR